MADNIITLNDLSEKKFVWGKIKEVLRIGIYTIVEYYPDKHDNNNGFIEGQYEDYLNYHPFVNNHDTSYSFDSLDKALIHCVSCNSGHSRASEFIINMLSFKD